eukprot:CAMPEP_0181173294 /NCGR_PEP_ID=MMETSP1096-20121128/2920_1 /TAXON_ID=156174 ORGANISM="Chrysochromulina ericina, Strain CCMP281" /NCGR_SAMPLE_ID=MMETSP1096 /ASSEMBLY_ACC=CAM_ASM_000453 /LENGTH=129 /DNA_ID=CAMNT_0023261107 /DNA_START=173 /DNA_END=563 /DNA_ORIENTATION=+
MPNLATTRAHSGTKPSWTGTAACTAEAPRHPPRRWRRSLGRSCPSLLQLPRRSSSRQRAAAGMPQSKTVDKVTQHTWPKEVSACRWVAQCAEQAEPPQMPVHWQEGQRASACRDDDAGPEADDDEALQP